MKESEILKLMNDISDKMPLSLENADDGRYTWPARWKELFNQIFNWPKGTFRQDNNKAKVVHEDDLTKI